MLQATGCPGRGSGLVKEPEGPPRRGRSGLSLLRHQPQQRRDQRRVLPAGVLPSHLRHCPGAERTETRQPQPHCRPAPGEAAPARQGRRRPGHSDLPARPPAPRPEAAAARPRRPLGSRPLTQSRRARDGAAAAEGDQGDTRAAAPSPSSIASLRPLPAAVPPRRSLRGDTALPALPPPPASRRPRGRERSRITRRAERSGPSLPAARCCSRRRAPSPAEL